MDNFYQTQRPYNPYQNQAYTIPYIGNITSVKGAESTMLKLQSVSFDMTYIVEQQDSLKEKYTKKTRVN